MRASNTGAGQRSANDAIVGQPIWQCIRCGDETPRRKVSTRPPRWVADDRDDD
jgi:hypothetical protein